MMISKFPIILQTTIFEIVYQEAQKEAEISKLLTLLQSKIKDVPQDTSLYEVAKIEFYLSVSIPKFESPKKDMLNSMI